MTKGQFESTYPAPSSMSLLERGKFDQWLMRNLIIGSAWVVALAVIVVVGSNGLEQERTSAKAHPLAATAVLSVH